MMKIFFYILQFTYVCSAFKLLLVFPIPGKSHSILGEGYVKHLLNAGHEVTYITPLPIKNPPPGLRQIDVASNLNLFPMDTFMHRLMLKEESLSDMNTVLAMMRVFANGTLMHGNVQNLINDPNEEFDAVIIEWMYNELYSGFALVFDCPMIWSSSMEPHYLVLSLIDEDTNPAYTADVYTSDVPPYTLIQRAKQMWSYIVTRFKKWRANDIEEDIFRNAFGAVLAKKGRELASLSVAKYNGSLMLGNSHVSMGQALRLPQNYKPIAGYHINDEFLELPPHLQTIMDNAKEGVIYFSMGSMLKSKYLPSDTKTGLLNMFKELKQTVIWKFEEQLESLPNNVYIVHWAPQPSILAHPNCKLFITHGGLLSTIETIHFGVPIIGIPMYADQFTNVNRAVEKGFAIAVNFDANLPINLKAAIEAVTGKSRYRNRVEELSFIYHHRPVPPSAELVHWVEHVVRTRGAPHLRSPALRMPFYQKMYLDLATIVIISLFVIAKTIRCSFSKSKNTCANKKNN